MDSWLIQIIMSASSNLSNKNKFSSSTVFMDNVKDITDTGDIRYNAKRASNLIQLKQSKANGFDHISIPSLSKSKSMGMSQVF